MFLEQFRSEWGIQRGRVRPSEHLLLSTRIVEVVEKFAEPIDEIAFGEQYENGETDVQFALNYPELARDFAGLPFHFLRGVADQALNRDREKESVHGTIGPILFEQAQELSPLARCPRLNLLENQAAGSVQDDRVIREPPIHVDGSTDALKFVLQSGREPGLRSPDSLSLSRTRLAGNHVPGQAIKIFAGGLEFFDAFCEITSEIL